MNPPAAYPKLSYRTTGDHEYELRVQARPRGRIVPIGTVKRYGSLPSMQRWYGCGNWDDAKPGRARETRADAGAQVWGAWRAREQQRIIAAAAELDRHREALERAGSCETARARVAAGHDPFANLPGAGS